MDCSVLSMEPKDEPTMLPGLTSNNCWKGIISKLGVMAHNCNPSTPRPSFFKTKINKNLRVIETQQQNESNPTRQFILVKKKKRVTQTTLASIPKQMV